ncbi:MAG TPA: type IV toxin-antitoxin system AbiEi family antitoxin [Kineosporiaceae bacterium]
MTDGAAEPWFSLARGQDLVIARHQLLLLEGSDARARRGVRTGRWQVLVPGVYAVFTGPVPMASRLWACLLHAGPGAAAGGDTALWLAGVRDRSPDVLEVCVPHGRRVRPVPGCVVVRRRQLSRLVHPALRPPRVRVEEAVLDVTDRCGAPAVIVDVLLTAVQRRLTTPERLCEALARRPRHRGRGLLLEVLAEAAEGVRSALEHRYLRQVERAHGLPRALRNAARPGPSGGTEYPDLRYDPWRVTVELDGAVAHPAEHAFRDRARDNRGVVAGRATLRYGWREVAHDPCGVAAEVAAVLTSRGWTGRARACGRGCGAARA